MLFFCKLGENKIFDEIKRFVDDQMHHLKWKATAVG